jgi:hypothetical protein
MRVAIEANLGKAWNIRPDLPRAGLEPSVNRSSEAAPQVIDGLHRVPHHRDVRQVSVVMSNL